MVDPVDGDGIEGSFEVTASDKTGDDFRAKGRIAVSYTHLTLPTSDLV